VVGILYERNDKIKTYKKTKYKIEELENISSVIKNFIVFAQEKWRIASDKSGSGNTANIGSVKRIKELLEGKGIFWQYFGEDGEKWFDEYWMNYGRIKIKDNKGKVKTITSLEEFLKFKGVDVNKIRRRKV
jgi:hypothetical protein